MVAKTLHQNSDNPQLAWLLFNRTLASNSKDFSFLRRTLPLIVPILIRHHRLRFPSPPHHALYSVVKMLAEAGHIEKAFSQFQSLRGRLARQPPSIVLYNLLIRTCIKQTAPFVSWLYKDIIFSKLSLQTYTFNLLIGALCDSGRLEDARPLFVKMRDKGCEPNEYTFGILARGYCRNGLVVEKVWLELLDLMETIGLVPNAVIYNTFIASLCKEGKDDEAERLVEWMKEDGLSPNLVTFNARISALCKAGKNLEAFRIFRDMQSSELGVPVPDVVTHNLMLNGFCSEGMSEEAEALVMSMKRDAIFSSVESYNIWLLGLASKGKLFEAQSVLKEMVDDGVQPNVYSFNILINGLCKSGMLADARRVVSLMITGGVSPDVTTYSVLLQGYCKKGCYLY